MERYGDRCWELDALHPVTLRDRIEEEIQAVIDWDEWERCETAEEAQRESLGEFMSDWVELHEAAE